MPLIIVASCLIGSISAQEIARHMIVIMCLPGGRA